MQQAQVEVAPQRPGINIHIGSGDAPVVSDVWTSGGWRVQFVRLDAHQRFPLEQRAGRVHVKVVRGTIDEVGLAAYPAVGIVRSTVVTADEVQAGPAGAVFAVLTATPAVPGAVTDMGQLSYSGPLADHLGWQTFEQRYHAATPFFDGLDAYLAPGFHLLDAAGDEISYVFVWTAGKGVDLSTHNHGRPPSPTAPAFAEVHWVVHNGTGSGGMYETPEPGSPVRHRTPMAQGTEHGPFFHFDPATGRPLLRDNGAVDYPWHGWEAGTDGEPGQSYDVVMAFEITAPYADVLAGHR